MFKKFLNHWSGFYLILSTITVLASSWGLSTPVWALTDDDIDLQLTTEGLQFVLDVPETELVTIFYAAVAVEDCHTDLGQQLLNELEVTNQQALLPAAKLTATTYCFIISSNDSQSVFYRSYQIMADDLLNLGAPLIKIARSSNTLLTIFSDSPQLDNSSWRWQTFEQAVDCQEQATALTKSNQGVVLKIALREADNGRYFCVSLANAAGLTAFAGYQITGVDTTPPLIEIQQASRQLVASANETVSRWSHTFSPSELQCNASTFLNNRSSVAGATVNLTGDRMNYHYCFRAADAVGNFGYGKYQVTSVDFTASIINLRQQGHQLILTSNDQLTAWMYLKSETNLACDQQTDFSNSQPGSSQQIIPLQAADHHFYFCVKALNQTNSASFAKLQVSTATEQQIKIIIDQEEETITATSLTPDLHWTYIISQQPINCDSSDNKLFNADNPNYYVGHQTKLYKADNGHWFCFRARSADRSLTYYAKEQIEGISRLLPSERRRTDFRRDLTIVLSILCLVVVVIILHKIRQAKQFAPQLPAEQPLSKKRRRQTTSKQTPDLVQPLDFLKKDEDK